MYRPFITWALLVAFFIIVFIVRGSIACRRHHKGHIIEIGSERDEFFVPGDRTCHDKSRDYEDC